MMRCQSRDLDRTAAPPDDRSTEPEQRLLERLRSGDEAEFGRVLAAWSPAMRRVAAWYVGDREAAEDVVQETWLAVLQGLPAFEGRSSLRTWTFAILANRARTHAVRARRVVPWSCLAEGGDGADSPERVGDAGGVGTVDPGRFIRRDDPSAGHWTSAGAPRRWSDHPEDASLAREARGEIGRALACLPERQRAVVTLRDVTGLSSDEACELLGISALNQRVLLHRGRARLRAALEDYYRR